MGKYAGYTKNVAKPIVTLTEDSKEIQLFEAAGISSPEQYQRRREIRRSD